MLGGRSRTEKAYDVSEIGIEIEPLPIEGATSDSLRPFGLEEDSTPVQLKSWKTRLEQSECGRMDCPRGRSTQRERAARHLSAL
jgi:hypothetical protein